jgi:hypothetical protein
VGATGLVVNQLAFWTLTDVFGLYYLWAFLLATQFSTAWNFVLLERYVFDGSNEGRWARLGLVRPDEQRLERLERAGDVRDHDRLRRAEGLGELDRRVRHDARALRDLEPADLARSVRWDRPARWVRRGRRRCRARARRRGHTTSTAS